MVKAPPLPETQKDNFLKVPPTPAPAATPPPSPPSPGATAPAQPAPTATGHGATGSGTGGRASTRPATTSARTPGSSSGSSAHRSASKPAASAPAPSVAGLPPLGLLPMVGGLQLGTPPQIAAFLLLANALLGAAILTASRRGRKLTRRSLERSSGFAEGHGVGEDLEEWPAAP
jgi:hypothetical protein